jgi:type VI secretion system protein ImpF
VSGRAPPPRRVRPSLLDRLLDDAPGTARDGPAGPADSPAALRNAVRRDLEALLNARRRWRSWPSEMAALAVSPLGYGLPDFAAGAFNDPARREELRVDIEDTIRRFEPRLSRVQVAVAEADDTLRPTLHLRIEALLHAEPAPEPVAFDTLVDPATDNVLIRADEAG